MAEWQSGFIHANGLRHHYARSARSAHSDKPPIVLAHGFSDDGLCWASVAEKLAATYDVVMVDARGHGRSDAAEQGYGVSVQVDDLAGVIGALGLQQPIVMGHSMGAMTALVLAGRYPSVPRAIVLEDPPPWWVADYEPPYSAEWRTNSRAWITDLQQQSREALLAAQRAESPAWPEADLQAWADSKLAFSLNFYQGLVAPDFDWLQLVGGVRCPTLLVTADPTLGSLVTALHAALLKTMLPQVQIASIAGAGHSIRRDQLQRFMAAVEAFLAALPPR